MKQYQVEIQNSNGDIIYPHTTDEVVFDGEGQKLSETIKTIKNNIELKVSKEEGKGLSSADYTQEEKEEVKKIKDKLDTNDLLDKIYPIGSIYTTTKDNNPNSFIGGNWEKFAEGKTLVGVSLIDSDFYEGKEGGSKTHTLTIDELPPHSHNSNVSAWGGGNNYSFDSTTITTGGVESTGSVGGNMAHNNMPPYVTVYFWQRTA